MDMSSDKPRNLPLSVALDRLIPFDRQLLEMRDAGIPYKEISRQLGRHERMLTSRITALRKLPATMSDEEAAERLEASGKSVGAAVPKTTEEMSQDDRELVRMYREGMSLVSIGIELDRNPKTVSSRLIRLRKALGTNVVPIIDESSAKAIRNASAPVSAEIQCMCCRRQFKSWDRMRNRICSYCKSAHSSIDYSPEARVCA
jgi:DNA-binding CsgD family transcriptional regulator